MLDLYVATDQMGPATGLLALAALKKDQQPSAHDRSTIINRRPQLLKPQYSYEPTQGPCGALNLSLKTAPTESERLAAFLQKFRLFRRFVILLIFNV